MSYKVKGGKVVKDDTVPDKWDRNKHMAQHIHEMLNAEGGFDLHDRMIVGLMFLAGSVGCDPCKDCRKVRVKNINELLPKFLEMALESSAALADKGSHVH